MNKIHYLDDDGRYLCNKACGITPEKTTRKKEEITCRNCDYLFWKKRREEFENL